MSVGVLHLESRLYNIYSGSPCLKVNPYKDQFQFFFLSVSTFCSQDPVKSKAQMGSCKDFNIITLNDISVHDISSKVQTDGLLEIGFTILYR